ncbi:MAG: TonB-dependent receptor plug domain-containing protein, partial [Porphyromonadaceae bacterium]|nr:TonB-dependent receptor plug domain-containing protein [Porphyromonadaceae bacterium]
MKLTLILTMLVFFTFGNSYSQTKVTLHFEKATIQQVLKTLEDQTGHVFLYKDEIFDAGKKYSVDFTEEPFEEVLSSVCATAGVDYELKSNRQIILTEKGKEAAVTRITLQQRTVTGAVTDQSGQPLPGVTVIVKGTTIGTVTNADGNFTLAIPQGVETLQFSFVGMRTQEIPIEGRTTFTVVMEEEAIGIEEVIVVGYGTQKKVNLTGSVSEINSGEIEKRVTNNLSQALQGLSTNLNISVDASGGAADASMDMNIRGIGSLSSSNPLILINGVRASNSELNALNPNDVQNISVLNDAASSAIYGAQAAYGVILIETKAGEYNKDITITYSNSFRLMKRLNVPKMAGSEIYAT